MIVCIFTIFSITGNNIIEILYKKPDEDHVINLLSECAGQYIKFSTALKVGSKYAMGLKGDDEEKLIQVISKWMSSQCSPVTWYNILEVVESETLGKNTTLGDKIRKWLAKDEHFSYYMDQY